MFRFHSVDVQRNYTPETTIDLLSYQQFLLFFRWHKNMFRNKLSKNKTHRAITLLYFMTSWHKMAGTGLTMLFNMWFRPNNITMKHQPGIGHLKPTITNGETDMTLWLSLDGHTSCSVMLINNSASMKCSKMYFGAMSTNA